MFLVWKNPHLALTIGYDWGMPDILAAGDDMNNITRDGLPDRLRALADDEINGISAVLSPGNSHDLLTAADEIERLREAIRRLAEQDATLSLLCKRDGSQVVTVTMDATLTDAEREAIEEAADSSAVAAEFYSGKDHARADAAAQHAATLRGLLERIGGER